MELRRSGYLAAMGVPSWYARSVLPGALESTVYQHASQFSDTSDNLEVADNPDVVVSVVSESVKTPDEAALPIRAKPGLAASLALTDAATTSSEVEHSQSGIKGSATTSNDTSSVPSSVVIAQLPSEAFRIEVFSSTDVVLISLASSSGNASLAEHHLAQSVLSSMRHVSGNNVALSAHFYWPPVASHKGASLVSGGNLTSVLDRFIYLLAKQRFKAVVCLGLSVNRADFTKLFSGAKVLVLEEASLSRCLDEPLQKREIWRGLVDAQFV